MSIAATTDGNEAGPIDGLFTLTQSVAAASNTVIDYTVTGSASNGTDYDALSGSVTILAGATSATITIANIVADALVEGTETVIITLDAITASDPGITIATASDSIDILDGDSATVSIAATTDGNEAGPIDGLFTLTQSVAAASNTVIDYTVTGSASDGTDYDALSGSVTILAGATSATITIANIVADALVEGTETVIITLDAITASDPGITIATASDSIDILDGDSATVSIAATTNANETGSVNGLFTLTQSATSASDTIVTYAIAGTATNGGSDYTTLSGTVTVLSGASTATIDVTGIIDDALVEGTETIIVTLTGTDNVDVTLAAGPADTATVNILDNNTAEVSIAATTNANETGSVNGLFTLTQSATSASDTIVTYAIAGTATNGGSDYTTLSGTVTVLSGATTATIDVTDIIDDALVEGTETIIVTLTGTDNVDVTLAAGPADTATVNILDNNTAEVSIAATTNANETGSVNGLFTLTQSATSASDTIVTYAIAGTATNGGSDYTTLSGTVTVLSGASTATIDVTGIIDDALVEGTETIIVTLTGTDNVDVTLAAGPADTATVNILDNNTAEVSIAATTNANETGSVNGLFTLTQSATSASDTIVTYAIAGTATNGGSDYTTLSARSLYWQVLAPQPSMSRASLMMH